MITLHASNITTFPQDNGIGVLRDVIRAYAEEELNGLFEFYMEYDSEGHLVDELKEERIIKAKAQDKLGYQLFRIYSITKNHENDNLIVRAQHITYDLADNFVESLVANNLTKKQVMELIGSSTVLPHPFNVTSSNTTTRSSTKLYRTNPLQMIGGIEGSVLQIWGGQIERDNFNLILHDRRGSDDGVKVTYEKNITGLEATFDISGLVTRIFPFVFVEGSDNEPDRLITVSGKYIDSPHINDYEKIYIRPIDYTHDERINLDGTDTQIRQQLTNIASQYFTDTGNDKIKVDMDVKFEHLWETEEYKHLAVLELVGMGDTVTIEHSRLKVNATAIVNYIRYDCIAEKNEEVRLGSVKARLTDNVNRVVDVAEKVEQAQQTANQAIKTANGKNTIYYGPDEPTNGIEGDLWFRVVDGEYTRTYRHDGIQWQLVLSVDVRDAMDEAQQAKDEAQQAVERANQATQQATNAINQAQTAFDEAQNALGTANNAMTQATSAFSLANDAFNEVGSLSTIVDENTGEISTIKQSVIGLQTRVSDNEGNISNLTQIAQGLQTQVTDIEGNVSTLQQTAQGLQSTVTNLQNELDGLEIGGRNLIGNSNYHKTPETYFSTVQVISGNPNSVLVTRNGSASWGVVSDRITNIVEGQVYTLSFEVKTNDVTILNSIHIMDKDEGNIYLPISIDITADGQWHKYIVTFTSPATRSNAGIMIAANYNRTSGNQFELRKLKLELGNKATDWTPAPEDVDHQFSVITQTIDNITIRVGDAEGNITALQQTANSLAGRLTDVEGNITTLTATVSGLQTTVSNIEGDVSSVTQLANALQVRMTSAEGNISTLTQTASSLQSTVSSLQSEIDNIDIHILQGGGKQFENLAARAYETGSVVGALVIKTPITYPYMTRVEIVGYNYQSGANDIDLTVSFYAYTNNTFNHYSYKSVGIRKINKVRLARENGKAVIIIEDVNSTWSYPKIIIKSALIGHSNPPDSYKDGWDIAFETNLSQYTNVINVSGADVQSQITQLSDAINLRVQKGDVLSQINIEAGRTLIDTDKLVLSANTTHITGDFKIDGSAHIKDASIGNAQIGYIDAAKITSGELNTNNITIRGGNATEYTYIQGAYLESRGRFTRTWRGTTKTHDIALRLQNGYLRARNDTENHSLYFSDMGISTYADGSGDGLASGTLAFRDTQYSTFLGVTLHSHYGVVALESEQNRIVIAPQTSSRQGTNHFSFRVKDNSWENSDGWISYGDISTNTYHSGLRFSKYSGRYTIYATNGNGDIDSGYFRAKGFIGELLPTGSYNYVRAERTRFVQPGTSTTDYADIQFRHALANTIRVNDAGANFYIGTSTGEVRITTNELSQGSYRPIRASAFNEASSREYKTNIEKYNESALEVINDLTVVTYNLKDDLANGILEKKIGFISEDSPAIATADGKAIQTYQLSAYNTKAIQELDMKFTNLEDKVNWLEIENQYLRQKIEQLEEMIA